MLDDELARGGVGVDEAHTLSARREQAGRAHPRHVAVRSARLQHRLARGRPHRGPDAVAHHASWCSAADTPIEQITKQLHKLINVIKIQDLDPAESIERELVLFKVNAAPERRHEIIEIANVFRAKIIDVGTQLADHRGDRLRRQDRGDGGPVPRVRHQGARPHRQDRAVSRRSRELVSGACRVHETSGSHGGSMAAETKGRRNSMATIYYESDCDPADHQGQEGRDHRLRKPGSRPRAEPARLGRRRPRRPARRARRAGTRRKEAGLQGHDAARGGRRGGPRHDPDPRRDSVAHLLQRRSTSR